MTPKHSIAVDPVFLHVLDLLDRISDGAEPNPTEEQIQIRALLDQGEAIVGSGENWELTKYALVSWIDEVLVSSSWSQRDWWSNNVLEVEFFNTRLCNEQFFLNAKRASQMTDRDALEVYYICVILDFEVCIRILQLHRCWWHNIICQTICLHGCDKPRWQFDWDKVVLS